MNFEVAQHVPTSWIEDQRLGLEAKLLTQLGKYLPDPHSKVFALYEKVNSTLFANSDTRDVVHESIVWRHTLGTYDALKGLEHKLFTPLHEGFQNAYHKVSSQLGTTKLITNRLKYSPLPIEQVLRIARTEGKIGIRGNLDMYGALESLAFRYRTFLPSTKEQLQAVNDFLVTDPPARWHAVTNSLLHSAFSWPLFIMSPQHGAKNECGYSLPVAIDVELGKATKHHPSVLILPKDKRNSPVKNFDSFLQSVRLARDVAIGLWKAKASAWKYGYIRQVENCQVVIDFSIANEITASLPLRNLKIHGRSLEAYLSLQIMSRLIDKSAMETTYATGVLGNPMRDIDDGSIIVDVPLQEADGLLYKSEWAYGHGYCDRLLIPHNNHKAALIEKAPRWFRIREGGSLGSVDKRDSQDGIVVIQDFFLGGGFDAWGLVGCGMGSHWVFAAA